MTLTGNICIGEKYKLGGKLLHLVAMSEGLLYTMSSEYPTNNRTWQIIHNAQKWGYAVGGFCVYNTEGVLAVIKAAETCRSPALIQFFPWTLHFQGPAFIKYAAELAHAASVPIAIHLDHCVNPKDADLALECAFDSIMVDGSIFDAEENVRYVNSVVERAKEKNITVEAELGRVDGGEDGLPPTDLEAVWTNPTDAARFVQETGVHFLAPSFGNVHGLYPPGGAEKAWQMERLEKIHAALGESTSLVLHGTHTVSDDMLRVAMQHGMIKINQNRSVREEYHKYIAENCRVVELTKLQSQGVEVYSGGVQRMMVEVFKSAGRA